MPHLLILENENRDTGRCYKTFQAHDKLERFSPENIIVLVYLFKDSSSLCW